MNTTDHIKTDGRTWIFRNSRYFILHLLYELFADAKRVIRNRKSQDRQYKGQMKNNKETSNYTEN